MKCCFLIFVLAAATAYAEALLPTAPGTTWQYQGWGEMGISDKGWPVGDYRVEVYVNDALTETAKLTIAK
jgi:hypothetical protein